MAVVFSSASAAVTNSAGKILMANASPEDAQRTPQIARKKCETNLGTIQLATLTREILFGDSSAILAAERSQSNALARFAFSMRLAI